MRLSVWWVPPPVNAVGRPPPLLPRCFSAASAQLKNVRETTYFGGPGPGEVADAAAFFKIPGWPGGGGHGACHGAPSGGASSGAVEPGAWDTPADLLTAFTTCSGIGRLSYQNL